MGEHGLWQKMSLFEESSRVPLMIAVPGRAQGGTVAEAPVSHVDLYPTLAELCGVPTPDNLQGQSLVPMLSDPSVKGRGWALSHVSRGGIRRASPSSPVGSSGNRFFGYSIRTPRWRYTEWDDGNQGRELYDHDADPKEMKNLAAETAHAATVEELSTLLRKAVKSSFPPDGITPPLMDGLWAPDITNPTDRGLQAAK
jgi:iduronate 2-sulfatase